MIANVIATQRGKIFFKARTQRCLPLKGLQRGAKSQNEYEK